MTALNNQNLLQLRFVNQAHIEAVKPSFANLPANPYADGAFRKRRYSVIKVQNDELVLQATKAFVQDDSINTFQGNVERTYENLEPSLLASEGMKSIVNEFRAITGISEERDIEIHQFRMLAIESDTPPAPEGIHQDGFDHVCICGVSHENLEGGELLVYENKQAEPCFKMEIKDGMFALINDREVWHNATPMNKIDASKDGYLDCFVLTA
ncbi:MULTISPECIES: 2OG-Fe dioxygenase family protein [unclassified Pseudoalteromonas]|uniref:2OG-Fe dioxygenase family protein n=1 Tax=unclassified Pseudoalteromonas TaxID=194690 RepID=UPI001601CBAB|nr:MULTISPECIES: 2OG-Fe dioxygenase family protein [unclassified Pseudoalteromonas]MBB1334791.1 2OG-Fe dioxygenase family protein [Pseudoalteromonas sp. SR41-6]MBB1344334.1 2OG-Fe dioxygenase family protein [Pseudoalteromonas sp. SR45-6]MBB1461070.1 2OG-Fe dioxygenase family protein [Pseudoalteromonas sp. SG41-8]